MRWDVSPNLAGELAEDGPWAWYLKDAWHACATDSSEIHIHRQPKHGVEDSHAKSIAYWTPMFHPLIFGLGWSRPDIGLLRWRGMGYPAVDPILGAALHWWGKDRIDSRRPTTYGFTLVGCVKELEDDPPSPRHLVTESGMGYRFRG
jgi:hypothetical protein